MCEAVLRSYRSDDLDKILAITAEAFDGVSIDQNIAQRLNLTDAVDWKEIKKEAIRDDMQVNPQGAFVAEVEGEVAGYITTRVNRVSGEGRIVNLAVDARFRGRGLGKALIQRSLDYFQELGLKYAKIETLEQNEIGRVLYPRMGFVEVARQIHYAMEL